MDNNVEIVEVRVIAPHLRAHYGHTHKLGKEKAILGQNAGLWEIIDRNKYNIPKKIENQQHNKNEIDPETIKTQWQGIISVIILALNNLSFTQRCIDSIRKYTMHQYQIILVDNGSTDETSTWAIKNLNKNDILIRNQYNRGFPAGNNQALKIACGEYVMLLNNDTEIQDQTWVGRCLEGLDYGDIVGPTLRKLTKDSRGGVFIFTGDGMITDPYHYLEGWCLFAKRSTFNSLGGLDEQFSPAYSEDADFSFKAKQAGYKLQQIMLPIIHHGNQTSSRMSIDINQLCTKNRRKLYQKWISKDLRSILIRRKGAIGDVLLTTPIIRALRKANPNAKIYYETEAPQMLENNPYIDEIITNISSNGFDLVVDLEYEYMPARNRIDVMAEQAGVMLDNRKLEVFFVDQQTHLKKPYIVIHTGRSWPNREWPIDRYKMIADYLKIKGFKIVQIGTQQTQLLDIENGIDFRGRPWSLVTSAIKEATCFLGIDSACSNLAKAVGTPAFIFYGCVDPDVMDTGVDEYPLIVNKNTLSCFGCRNRTSAHYVECIHNQPYCLTNIEAEDVIAKLGGFFKNLAIKKGEQNVKR